MKNREENDIGMAYIVAKGSNFRKVENNEQEDCEIIDLAVKPGELASINIDDPKPIVEFLSLEYIIGDVINSEYVEHNISQPNATYVNDTTAAKDEVISTAVKKSWKKSKK